MTRGPTIPRNARGRPSEPPDMDDGITLEISTPAGCIDNLNAGPSPTGSYLVTPTGTPGRWVVPVAPSGERAGRSHPHEEGVS